MSAAPEDYEAMNLERSGPEVELLMARYDAEIRYTDERIAALLQAVPRAEQSLLAITADHGEEFLDHGRFGHGASLHQELIRIPLVIRFPDRAQVGRSERVVSIVDLAPTFLAVAGAKEWPHHGQSLVPLQPGVSMPGAYPALATYAREGAEPIDALVLKNWKIIRFPEARRALLYDLRRDPAETRDLSAAEPDRQRHLLRQLMKTMARARKPGEPRTFREVTAEEEAELRSLGYLQ
jgi:arylsulfatase A-like enzyme